MGAAVAAAVMRRKERDLRETFFTNGAIQPIDARSMTDLGLEENMTWKRMCRHSVIRESSPGVFYWDDDVWQALRGTRMRMAVMMLVAVAVVGLVIAYGSAQLK